MCRNGKEWVTDGVMGLQGWNGGVSISRGVSITLHHNNTWDLMGGDAHSLRIPGISSCTVGQAETCKAIVHRVTVGQAESCRAIVKL